jgi:membrane protease YdiL (CAAX protease family)
VLKIALKALVFRAINPAYRFLEGNPAALPGIILTILVSAGFGEEIVYRGWMFERLGKSAITLVLTSLLFGAAHLMDQGVPGAAQAVVTGLVFGAAYLWTGRLWLSIVLHVAFDLTAVAIIAFGLEQAVAHLIF